MKLWINNPGTGKDDTMLSLGVYSLIVVLFKFLFSEITIGPVTFGQLDGTVVAAILASTLGAYCARRYTDQVKAKDNSDDQAK